MKKQGQICNEMLALVQISQYSYCIAPMTRIEALGICDRYCLPCLAQKRHASAAYCPSTLQIVILCAWAHSERIRIQRADQLKALNQEGSLRHRPECFECMRAMLSDSYGDAAEVELPKRDESNPIPHSYCMCVY